MSKPRSATPEPLETDRISVTRTALGVLLALAGLAYAVYYALRVFDSGSPAWMADLKAWNWLIGFGVHFVGLVVLSHRRTPLGRGRGVVVGMLGSFLIGLLWIVVYYVTSQSASVPVIRELGNYNLLVGIGFMAVGFVYATKWE